jgi:hypothetical protein
MLVSMHFTSSSLFLLRGDADGAEKKAPLARSFQRTIRRSWLAWFTRASIKASKYCSMLTSIEAPGPRSSLCWRS